MTVREIALSLLDEYESSGKYVNLSLSSHLADRLSREERAHLTRLLYTSVERKLCYDYIISALSKRSVKDIRVHTLNILRLGLCQVLDMDNIPDYAAVDETVKLTRDRGERGFVNAVLRSLCRAKNEGSIPFPDRAKNPARYLSVYYSFPLPVVKSFIGRFGEEATEQLLRTYNSQGYTDIAVNLLRCDRATLIDELQREGIKARPSDYSKIGVRIEDNFAPANKEAFKNGLFFVQDEACTLSAEALGAKEGDRVIDVCSAPGGKSFAVASLLSGRVDIHAFDIHESKLSLIKGGAERLGFDIKVSARDAREPSEDLFGTADRVICDVPCSGLGVLGKKPDIRYRERGTDKELPKLQYSILLSSAKYLKVGGVMLYSTCTLMKEENEEVIERFISESDGAFTLVDFECGTLRSEGGMLTMLPHIHNPDGFFMAKLQRVK